MSILRFSELDVFIDTEQNKLASRKPMEEFLGAPCELLGKQDASEWTTINYDVVFVHRFDPSEMEEGTPIKHTDLEYLTYSKPEPDISCKSWSAIAFDRVENQVYSTKGWSVWASDQGIKERWLETLQIQYNKVPTIGD